MGPFSPSKCGPWIKSLGVWVAGLSLSVSVFVGRRTQAETLGGGLPAAYCLLPKRELMIKQ